MFAGLLKRGSIRIGTTSEYRIPDGLDDGRSDENEVVSRWKPGETEVVAGPDHPFIKSLDGDKPRSSQPVTISFHAETMIITQANGYIFSASNQYSDELARQMAEKFDADACVRIDDPRAFMLALSESALLKGRPFDQWNVSYADINDFREFRSDPFLKQKKIEWQKEFRIAWGGMAPETGSIIEVPAIIPFLSLVR
jgi:hypothetical protein